MAAAVVAVGAAAAWLAAGRQHRAGATRPRLLRVGYSVEAPYAFLDAQGDVVGESAVSAGLIARRLGWSLQWVQTEFDLLIPDLLEGRFDVVDAGLFITPQRARLVRFAAPRLRVGPALLVRRGSPLNPRSWVELKEHPGLRLAVVGGSVEESRLRGLGFAPLLRVPDARAGAAAVLAQLVDGLALSLPTVRRMADLQPGLAALAVPGANGVSYVAAAFRPDDAGLLRAWNRAQAAIVGTPEHLAAIAPYGFTRADVVVPASAPAVR
jgi:polar amino acid transport system substrate-binding protein